MIIRKPSILRSFAGALGLIFAVGALAPAAQAQSALELAAELPESCYPAITNVQARESQSLNGSWQYILDPLGEINRTPDKVRTAVFRDVSDDEIEPNVLKEYDWERAPSIDVPGAWNTQDATLTWYDQWAWYRRGFTGGDQQNERSFVYFEGANYESVVYLNGELLGSHIGGFTPFCFEVTGLLEADDNTLVVGVNAEQNERTIPPMRADWNNYGGITRPVHLVHVPQTFVQNYRVALADENTMEFSARVNGAAQGQTVTLEIAALGVERTLRADADGMVSAQFAIPAGLQRWSPEEPTLYDVTVSSGGESVEDRIGFRTMRVADGEIYLNGEPLYLRGISLHEETLGEVPGRYMSEAAAYALLAEVKFGLNGNFVRLAHYPHSEAMVRQADEMGLLVWSEIPIYWDIDFANPEVLAQARRMQAENIDRDYNRASIFVWSVANETLTSDARNSFLRTLIADAREMDGTRAISLASHTVREGGGAMQFDDPVIEDIDIVSVNYYVGWYTNGPLARLEEIEWNNTTGKPMIFSELGAGALAGFESADNAKFSEDFQAAYYEANLAMAERIPTLRGLSPWILKDFRSPRRFHPTYQDGWNRKGLIAPDGRRKDAFYVLADWYANGTFHSEQANPNSDEAQDSSHEDMEARFHADQGEGGE